MYILLVFLAWCKQGSFMNLSFMVTWGFMNCCLLFVGTLLLETRHVSMCDIRTYTVGCCSWFYYFMLVSSLGGAAFKAERPGTIDGARTVRIN